MEKKLLSVFLPVFILFLSSLSGFGQSCDGTASVTISSNATNNTICAGTSVIFTATPAFAGANPKYQWRINGVNVENTIINTYTTSSLQDDHVVTVVLTPDCANATTVLSNGIATNVNPIPTITTLNSATVCSGAGLNISLTASTPSSFSWTVGTITGGITGANAGSGGTINQTLTNPSNSNAGTVQYIVTPTSSAGNCVGELYTITVTVNPRPAVTTANTKSICSGTATNISLTASTTSVFAWTIGAITGGITGASAGSGLSINQTLTNSSNSTAGTVQYIVTPTATAGSCAGSPYTITVTVNPTPSVTTQNTASICSGTAPNISLIASTPSGFAWTLGTITGGITGATAGSGAIINQTLTNPSNSTTGTVQYIVTPTATTGSCAGTPYTITVTVNPRPTVTTTNTAIVCSGFGPNISLASTTPSSFSWTIGNITGGITGASAASGTTINQTLSNPSNSTAGTVQYIVTPTSTAGSCAGTPYIITVTVNPTPSVTTPNNLTICSGNATNIALAATTPSSFTWALGAITGGITGASAGSGVTINQTLSNPGNSAAGTVQYIVTPTATAGSCPGTPYTITVTVNPRPLVSTANTTSICSGTGSNISLTASTPSTFAWTVGTITGAITGASAGTGATINQTLTNPSNSIAGSVQYIVTPTATATAGGCAGNPYTITVSVNPRPVLSNVTASNYCDGGSVTLNAATTVGGVNWFLTSTGGSSIGTGTTLVTNQTSGSSSTTYYAEATANGCTTATRTAVTAKRYVGQPTTSNANQASSRPSGPTSICPPFTGFVYQIPLDMTQTAESYIWNLPPGFTIIGDPLAKEITVNVSTSATIGAHNITVIASNPCGKSSESRPLEVVINSFIGVSVPSPTETVCAGNSVTVVGTLRGNAVTGTWSAPSGAFSNIVVSTTTPRTITATYNPSITSGNVDLTITTNAPTGTGCSNTPGTAKITLTVNPPATAVAGTAITACSNSAVNITPGSSATNNAGVIWTSNGTGTIANPTSLTTATYTPGTGETGPVTLTLTATANNGCTNAVSTKTLTISQAATAVAGTAVTACSIAAVNITAGSSATNNTGIIWTSNGTGTITNPTSLTTATYTPGTGETGPVTLTLTATGTTPCANAVSTKTLTISQAATAVAGAAIVACSNAAINITTGSSATSNGGILWTSNGTGTIANPTSITTATYTPGAGETGPVTLTLTATGTTPCANAVSTKTLTISQAATAVAGTAIAACSNAAINITSGSSATNNAGIIWTSNGTGTIANPTSLTTATYTPGAGETGDVTLTLSATGTTPCENAVSTKTLTISQAAIAVAGTAIAACSNAAINITSGSSATNNAGIIWTSNGTGTIANPTSITAATYTPGANETGEITLTLSATGTTPCENAVSTKKLTISQAATAVAGTAIAACSNAAINITSGSSATNNAGIIWTSNGTGTIANPTSLTTATYTPGAGETGEITLSLNATGNTGCENAVSTKTLIISQNVVITTQPAATQTVCSGFPVSLTVAATGTGLTYDWLKDDVSTGITTPTLSFDRVTTANAGTYTVIVKGTSPCDNVISSPAELIVNEAIVISNHPVNLEICEDGSATFNVSASGNIFGYRWRKDGISIFDGDNILGATTNELTILKAIPGDSGKYDVVISGTDDTCSQTISNLGTLIVNPKSTISLSSAAETVNQTICINTTITPITYAVGGGGTGASITEGALPAGVTGSFNAGAFTISGTPTAAGTFNYTVTTTGNCENVSLSGTIIVNPDSTIDLSSAAGTDNQTLCFNTAITPITYSVGGGGTGASITDGALPAGLNGVFNSGVFTISGTPTVAGTFTYTVTTTGTCVNIPLSGTIVINPVPVATIAAEDQQVEICFDGSAYNITAGVTAENYTSILWTVTSGSGTIDKETSLTEATFIPASGSSNVTITLTLQGLEGCSTAATATKEITIQPLPTVTAITYGEGQTEFCTNTTSAAPSVSGSNAYTGGTFSWVPANGETGSKTLNLNTTTGIISEGSTAGVYNITYSTPTGAICGVVEKTISVTITKLPVASFTYSAASFCKNSANPIPTIPSGGNSGIFTATPPGLSINSSTGEINISASAVGTYTVTNSIAAAKGCGAQSAFQTVIIDPLPIAGELNFQGFGRILDLCLSPGPNSGYSVPILLTGETGNVVRWRYRQSSATQWSIIPNYTDKTLTAEVIRNLGLTETTIFEAEISSGSCSPNVFSRSVTLSIIASDIAPTPVTILPAVSCVGDLLTLTSSTGYGSGGDVSGGDFDNANSLINEGWRVRRDGSTTNLSFPANGNTTRPNIWSNTNDKPFYTANLNGSGGSDQIWDSGDKKFAIVAGNNPSTLETPVFNTFAMESGFITFEQAYNLTAGSKIRVEISTDGGANYQEKPLYETVGTGESGSRNGFGTSTDPENKISLDLSEYLGQPSIRIRFHFLGKVDGDVWAIDGIKLPGGPSGVTSVWTDYTNPNNPVTIGTTDVVTYTPSLIGFNNFEIRTRLTFDSSGAACPVVENFKTIRAFVFDRYTTSVTAEAGTCGNYTLALIANNTGSFGGIVTSYPTRDGYIGEWAITMGGAVADPSTYTLRNSDSNSTLIPKYNPNATFEATTPGDFTFSWKLISTSKYPADYFDVSLRGKVVENTGCIPVITPTTVQLKECIALDFDGTDDYVDLGEGYNGNYSIEAWIRPEAATGTIISGPKFEITMGDLPPTILPNTRWYHIAASNGRLYVDGIDVQAFTLRNGGTRAFIGAKWTPSNATNFFSGWIEEVRIWNGNISQDQIKFLMNQRLQNSANIGVEIPMTAPGLPYSSLAGYYRLMANNILSGGYTPDASVTPVNGKLRNMETVQENTAPLPYTSKGDGLWAARETWTQPVVWDFPNSKGVNGDPIEWNIVKTSNDITSGGKDIKVLGLLSVEKELTIINPSSSMDEYNDGQLLHITHYLDLDGIIDLEGQSQLLMDTGSIVDANSNGYLDRDQQGNRNSFIYNYWSSPVSSTTTNGGYTIGSVLMDGTDGTIGKEPKGINFQPAYAAADGVRSSPITVSSYWLNTYYAAEADVYAQWDQIGTTGNLLAGGGFTMKGTAGNAGLTDEQNYTFRGKPNNGDFNLTIKQNENFLIGNPYPSAMDSQEFIRDNLRSGKSNTDGKNVFNGAIYLWDHFAISTHILAEYIGGYATLNLVGGVKAISVDDRINNQSDETTTKTPQQFIPVGQAFMINSEELLMAMPNQPVVPIHGGDIYFRNDQRAYKREVLDQSIFLKPEVNTKESTVKSEETQKLRISIKSPAGYHRQILVGALKGATNGFDLGYDAPLIEDNVEDMYWVVNGNWLVIQGVPDFEKDQKLPLGIKLKEKGEFTIKIDEIENISDNKNIYIKDKELNIIHDLRNSPYKATAEGGYHNERFEIVFFKEVATSEDPPIVNTPKPDPGIPDGGGKDDEVDVTTLTVRHSNTRKEIQILNPDQLPLSNLYIFDMTGKQVMHYRNFSHDKQVILPVRNYSSGVYTIKLYSDGKAITKKIIIGN